ncbi:dicarboxylate/amino acid:cation symporter [Pseudomonas oryzihabitans]|uniref:dicarboxylate/amino acid:cation symporter n=1 Tax=Pseudomonas oryzihabitans TaxID=47885 RepID=UPI00119FBC14|nr:dicarboxylate/amino acid:cation symporter [Pseudomonas oryzihabitans]QEU03979.1 dicarboxylate/amino acid:cation symporter [Pseudomonas oryzihabitans]
MKKALGKLYVQVLLAVIAGSLVGVLFPETGAALKPLGDAFIKLIKMLLAPVIFLTVVTGIAGMENMKELGRVGFRALIYFEVVSTLALVVGLVVANVLSPGSGMNVDVSTLDTSSLSGYATAAKHTSAMDFLMGIIPHTIVDAFAKGNVLQILLFSVLLGVALANAGPRAKLFVDTLDSLTQGMFRIVSMVMRLAPIGAFGAIAFTIGKYGFGSLFSLGKLVACVYLTCALFVIFVLGPICRYSGFSLWKFLKYIKEELFTVLGTCSSESVLPQMISKMERAGVSKPVAGLVIPSGLTFNPDGQAIYYTIAAIFIAQATNTPLTLTDQLIVLTVLMFTSKGSAGVAGAGFIILTATLASLDTIPVAGMVLLLGVDRFMSEARGITNTIGNGVGTMAIAKWVGALDTAKMNRALDGEDLEEPRDAARSETTKSATSPSETLVQLPDVTSRALKH